MLLHFSECWRRKMLESVLHFAELQRVFAQVPYSAPKDLNADLRNVYMIKQYALCYVYVLFLLEFV